MSLDFTFDRYREICQSIASSDYAVFRVADFMRNPKEKDNAIILRHDVDRDFDKALLMARIEESFNIKSSYYFRFRGDVFLPERMKEFADMGHEVGYHYEVLDKSRGDEEKAVEIFKSELKEFRKYFSVETVCMHGNPLTKWDSRDLWKEHKLEDYGLIGDCHLSFDFSKVAYITDTGRNWNPRKYNIKDIPLQPEANMVALRDSRELISLIQGKKQPRLLTNIHPNLWSETTLGWAKILIWKNIKNIGKTVLNRLNLV
ncbi:hypothetical protein ACFLRC_03510 [Candidatus Altiarchaeota archaeon]